MHNRRVGFSHVSAGEAGEWAVSTALMRYWYCRAQVIASRDSTQAEGILHRQREGRGGVWGAGRGLFVILLKKPGTSRSRAVVRFTDSLDPRHSCPPLSTHHYPTLTLSPTATAVSCKHLLFRCSPPRRQTDRRTDRQTTSDGQADR